MTLGLFFSLAHRRAERSLVALPPSPDLFVHARELLVEANRLEATKAGITVGQEQRPSIYAVLFAGPISPVWNGSRLSARQDHPHRAGQPLGERLHREAAPRCQRGLLARSASRALSASGRTDGPFDLILTNEPEDLRLKLVAANSVVRRLMPVRARLATRPLSTGSAPVKEMMGIVVVAAFAADAAAPIVTITATCLLTNSAASEGSRSI